MKVKLPLQQIESSPLLAVLAFSVSLGWASQVSAEDWGFNDSYRSLPALGELQDGMYVAQD